MPEPQALSDAELARLNDLIEALPEPLEPLDASALDGFLCAVLLQPQPVPPARWLRYLADASGEHPVPDSPALRELQALAQRRHAELDAAIARRRWFDPWVFEPADTASPPADAFSAMLLPWVAGFATGMLHFPDLDDAFAQEEDYLEPLALLYRHLPPQELEDAEDLLAVIAELDAPPSAAEAVQDVVRAVLTLADLTRPLPSR